MKKRYYPIVFNVQFTTSKSLFVNKATRLYSLLLVMFLSVGMAQAQIVFDNSPGSGAPPATLGPYTMTNIPEPRADYSIVSTIASPFASKQWWMITVIDEIGFYLSDLCTATIIADQPGVMYGLSIVALTKMEQEKTARRVNHVFRSVKTLCKVIPYP